MAKVLSLTRFGRNDAGNTPLFVNIDLVLTLEEYPDGDGAMLTVEGNRCLFVRESLGEIVRQMPDMASSAIFRTFTRVGTTYTFDRPVIVNMSRVIYVNTDRDVDEVVTIAFAENDRLQVRDNPQLRAEGWAAILERACVPGSSL